MELSEISHIWAYKVASGWEFSTSEIKKKNTPGCVLKFYKFINVHKLTWKYNQQIYETAFVFITE